MKIVEIFPPNLYSISFKDLTEEQEETDEYHRLLRDWMDPEWLVSFFEDHHAAMDSQFWGNITDPEVAAARTLDEAYLIEQTVYQLAENTKTGTHPDFDDFFVPLGGEYVYVWYHTPVKGYGPKRPSLLRIYAIKIQPNCYLITGGGIKYCRTMPESQELRRELNKIERVKSFLKDCGIDTQEDI